MTPILLVTHIWTSANFDFFSLTQNMYEFLGTQDFIPANATDTSSQSYCYKPTPTLFLKSCLEFYCSLLISFLPTVFLGSNAEYRL